MAEKKSIEVLVGGKVYHISGTESEEHLQKVADFLNERLRMTRLALNGREDSPEHLLAVTSINICDDVLKLVELVRSQQETVETLKKQNKQLEQTLSDYEDEMTDLESENLALKEEIKQLGKDGEQDHEKEA